MELSFWVKFMSTIPTSFCFKISSSGLTGFLRKNRDSAPTRGISPSNGSITTLNTPWIYGNKRDTLTHIKIYTTREGVSTHYWHPSGPWHSSVVEPLRCSTWQVVNSITACLYTCPMMSSTFSITHYDNYKDDSIGSAGCVMWPAHSCSNPQ